MSTLSKSNIDKSFGKLLRDYRIKAGLTQEKLSEQLGISLKYISRIENGNGGIKTQTLIRYMDTLGITPNLLYQDFITNPSLKKHLELSEKIQRLSPEKINFAIKMIDELKRI